jgi:uncharacterized protein (TIGR02145 family)
MKKQILTFVLLVVAATGFSQTQKAQTLQVGATSTTLSTKAAVQIDDTARGILFPRMTSSQRDAITTPPTGLTIYNTTTNAIEWFDGTSWYNIRAIINSVSNTGTYPANYVGTKATVVDITSSSGKIWMDRNLGASQVASSANDANAYGGYFQWGRFADGHQVSNSATTTTTSNSDTPADGKFINVIADWRTTPNNTLWQGIGGTNNPCPNGYRVPTSTELNNEFTVLNITNTTNAASSILKIPANGYRDTTGVLTAGSIAHFWTSTASGVNSSYFTISSTSVTLYASTAGKGYGMAVRCIKGN